MVINNKVILIFFIIFLISNLRNKLVQWFKVVFQWDPKKRGKQHENGVTKLVVFELLHSILSKQVF